MKLNVHLCLVFNEVFLESSTDCPPNVSFSFYSMQLAASSSNAVIKNKQSLNKSQKEETTFDGKLNTILNTRKKSRSSFII